jgi:hypothetical protein
MRIYTLIELLHSILVKHGNIEVIIEDSEFLNEYHKIKGVTIKPSNLSIYIMEEGYFSQDNSFLELEY